MARWDPDARPRLVLAALDLFAEQGYDDTTVAQIAERAGLTRSTFFRYFTDKREILVAGQETLSALLTEGIAEATAGAGPLDAVASGLANAARSMTAFNHELAPRIRAAVDASAELQERDALKAVGMTAAMADALVARGVPLATARLAAELGTIAFKMGFAMWTEPGRKGDGAELEQLTLSALAELRTAAAALT